MADETTNEASAPTVDQAASQETAQVTVADNAVAGEPAAPTHEEVAFSDRAAMLFEELVRHIKSEETALVGGIESVLSDLVAKVRG